MGSAVKPRGSTFEESLGILYGLLGLFGDHLGSAVGAGFCFVESLGILDSILGLLGESCSDPVKPFETIFVFWDISILSFVSVDKTHRERRKPNQYLYS